ncbi:MAG: Gldg family protein [Methylophilales bacterium]|nr:Gldg family protein [Methylophilales bacterium]
MKINRKLKLQYIVQNSLFVFLFLSLVILAGFLSNQFVFVKDMTQANRSVLTKGSIEILEQMSGPINLTIFATNDDANNGNTFRQGIINFIAKYQRSKSDIKIKFINPVEEPKLAQDMGVRVDGEVVVEYNKRTEHITPPFAEQDLTNLFVRLSRTNNKPVMYLDGHGEKNLRGLKNYDLGEFGKQLENKGLKFSNPDLTVLDRVPDEGAMLVIASPKVDVTKVEANKILTYLNSGGNLLWLLDDNNLRGLDKVAAYLGVTISDSKVIDPSSLQYGASENVSFALAYGDHPITNNFMLRTQYLNAHEVIAKGTFENGWEVSNLIDVAPNGWVSSKKKDQDKQLTYDSKFDKKGPINIAVALKRTYEKKGQRVIVVGNSSFLSNNLITSGGNLDLGVNIMNWLAGDDRLITIQPMPLKDINVVIPEDSRSFMIAWTVFHAFQYFIPIGLFIYGFWQWHRRRKV